MRDLLSRALRIIFDFRGDVDDLKARLKIADATVKRQAVEKTQLIEEIADMIDKNGRLQNRIDNLEKEIASLRKS